MMQPHYAIQLDHLSLLCAQPGWKAYAWQRAKELDADASGLWRGIAGDLTARVNLATSRSAANATGLQ